MELIYLDYNSTTPVDPDVLAKMLPWFSQKFGNASSKTHVFGWEAESAVELAREQIANLIACEPAELIFCSGATEGINLGIRGTMQAYQQKGRHLITCATEHKAVLDTCADLEKKGAEITILDVDREGRIDHEDLIKQIRPDTIMVCIMMANNETGTLQDIAAISQICRSKGVLLFCDLSQAVGKIRVDVNEIGIDLACLSAHKFYGPKGTGALFIRRKNPRVSMLPQITGGGHERGLRSGTLNVPGIVGMGWAAQKAGENLWDYGIQTSRHRTWLEQVLEINHQATINGCIKNRLPNTTNLYFEGIKSEDLIKELSQLAFSTGSACTSAIPEPSHVLKAMRISDTDANSSIRLSVGRFTTDEEISIALQMFEAAIQKIRKQ
ncbi:IscS subfamily cysteine desulfurase [soil metagenome]